MDSRIVLISLAVFFTGAGLLYLGVSERWLAIITGVAALIVAINHWIEVFNL